MRTGTARHPDFGERQCVQWDDESVTVRVRGAWSYESVVGAEQNGWSFEWDPEPACDRPHVEAAGG